MKKCCECDTLIKDDCKNIVSKEYHSMIDEGEEYLYCDNCWEYYFTSIGIFPDDKQQKEIN